jgi:hypothetical protein
VGREEYKEGKRKWEKIERDEKEQIRVEKGKWCNRSLSKLLLGQNGEGS